MHRLITLFLIHVLIAFPVSAAHSITERLDPKLKFYHDSGQYDQDIQKILQQAAHYITNRVHKNQQSAHPKKLAVILDVDETSLSNYPVIARKNFNTSPIAIIHQHIDKGSDPAIKPMLAFFNQLKKSKVAIFFITGRHLNICRTTKNNLHRAGYHHWTGIYCRPEHDHASSMQPFKSKTRKYIAQKGYAIIANIGDQKADLNGGHAERIFQLPNPFYSIK